MLFNWIPPKISQRQFRIRIWNDAGGVPGSVIYEDSLVSPKYEYQFNSNWGNLTNMFYPYLLTTPQKLSGTFYVGWIQYTTDLLNIGFDKNTQNNGKMFFNIGNGWNQSQIPGSWMIHPVLGSAKGLLDVNEQNLTAELNVYPNPTNGTINLEILGFENLKIKKAEVYDILGECIYQQNCNSVHLQIDLSSHPNGIYLLKTMDETGAAHSQKLILSK